MRLVPWQVQADAGRPSLDAWIVQVRRRPASGAGGHGTLAIRRQGQTENRHFTTRDPSRVTGACGVWRRQPEYSIFVMYNL